MVPGTGLEPARLAPHAPQACVSTNFTTRAFIVGEVIKISEKSWFGNWQR